MKISRKLAANTVFSTFGNANENETTLKRLLKRSKDAQVYGFDISEESVAKARQINADVLDKQVFVQQGSAEKLPYEDGKFDLVTAVETVYFWPNLSSCLKEIRRVLKPGDHFAIIVEVVGYRLQMDECGGGYDSLHA